MEQHSKNAIKTFGFVGVFLILISTPFWLLPLAFASDGNGNGLFVLFYLSGFFITFISFYLLNKIPEYYKYLIIGVMIGIIVIIGSIIYDGKRSTRSNVMTSDFTDI